MRHLFIFITVIAWSVATVAIAQVITGYNMPMIPLANLQGPMVNNSLGGPMVTNIPGASGPPPTCANNAPDGTVDLSKCSNAFYVAVIF